MNRSKNAYSAESAGENCAKSVLFLADRVSMGNQATGAFKKHFSESNPVNLGLEKDKTSLICTCTCPTMIYHSTS